MKSSITRLIRKLRLLSLFACVTLIAMAPDAVGQQYVSSTTVFEGSNAPADAIVTNEANVNNAPDGNVATIFVEGVTVNIAGLQVTRSSNARLVMTFSPGIAAGVTTYVRISDFNSDVIALKVDELVGVLGLLNTGALTFSSNGGAATTGTLVRNAANELFLAITPPNAYTAVSIGLNFAAAATVGLGNLSMDIDYAVAYTNTTFTACESILRFTNSDPEATGVSLSLTDALKDPEEAIDDIINTTNFSTLQTGEVTALAQISQVIDLTKTVPGTTEIVATVSKIGLLLDVSALGNIFIQAKLGNAFVGPRRTLSSLLLGVNLLDFNSSSLVTVAFAPGTSYDGISITVGGVVDVLTSINIHEVSARSPVTFTGGRLLTGRAGTIINRNLIDATLNVTPSLPGFSIGCGASTSFTYEFFEVTGPAGGRVLAGSLPPSFALTGGTTALFGTPAEGEFGIFNFDVQATNSFGQSAITTFVLILEDPLPVNLVEFNAKPEGTTTLLSWSTASESNSDRFDVERSQSGRDWEKIGSVKSNQESSDLKYYSFSDNKPLDGQNLYRLKMIDLDETFAYSRIENVNFSSTAFLYPNPVVGNENLNINATDWTKVKSVKVINAMGKTVFEASNALSTGINTKNLAAGAYFVKMVHINGSITTHKFVRQ